MDEPSEEPVEAWTGRCPECPTFHAWADYVECRCGYRGHLVQKAKLLPVAHSDFLQSQSFGFDEFVLKRQ